MPETVKARKGMVVAWCQVSRITYQDHRPDTSSETWRLGLVAQASREGVIRKATEFGYTAAEDEDVRAFVRPFLDSAHQVKSSPPTT